MAKKEKVRHVQDYKTLPTWIVSLGDPRVICSSVSYLKSVAEDFFILQFACKFKFIKIPIVHVDNPLDQKVPFNPRRIADYLGFVNYWIRPLGLLICELGRNKAIPHLKDFYRRLTKAYKSASEIYRFRLSTTDRPHYKRRIYFAGVHMLDPHYLCVPSLHITIVCLTYSFMRKVFESERFSEEKKSLWNQELYAGAVNIGETVLYVKQHSVNCVSAALYMTRKIFSDLFSKEDALGFLDSMFQKSRDIPSQDKEMVVGYMKSLYLQFESEGESCDDWKEPVKKWLIKSEKRADNSKYGRPD